MRFHVTLKNVKHDLWCFEGIYNHILKKWYVYIYNMEISSIYNNEYFLKLRSQCIVPYNHALLYSVRKISGLKSFWVIIGYKK